MKKLSLLFAIGIICNVATTPIISMNDYSSVEFEDEDDIFDDFDNSGMHYNLEELNSIPRKKVSTRGTYDPVIANAVRAHSGVEELLNQELYLKTSPIRTRNIFDSPMKLHHKLLKEKQKPLSATFFYNATNQKNYTQDSTTINSYVDIENMDRVDILEQLLGDSFDIGESLKNISPAKVQEKRMGILFQSHHDYNNWSIDFELPLYYTERNLFFTEKEKSALYDSPLLATFSRASADDEWKLAQEHFISDQFGFGDLKIKLLHTKMLFPIKTKENISFSLGGFLIIPSSFAIKKGLIGTYFEQNNDKPSIDIGNLELHSLTNKNKEELATFFMGAIDKLSSNILHTPLGNKRHITAAINGNLDWKLASPWSMNIDYALEVPFPANEQRFYRRLESSDTFTTEFNAVKEDDALLVVFANKKLQDMFYPDVYKTTVFPGIILNSTTTFSFKTENNWNLNTGYNFWYQGEEHLSNIQTTSELKTNLDIDNATAESASQVKLFARMHRMFEGPQYLWSLSAYADMTVWNSGIGNDITVGLSVDYKF